MVQPVLPNYVLAIAAWKEERGKGLCSEIGSQHFMREFYFATHSYHNTKIMIVSSNTLVDVLLHCCVLLEFFMLCCPSAFRTFLSAVNVRAVLRETYVLGCWKLWCILELNIQHIDEEYFKCLNIYSIRSPNSYSKQIQTCSLKILVSMKW